MLICLALIGCNNEKEPKKEENGFSFSGFTESFRDLPYPYSLTDSGFSNNRDTSTIRSAAFRKFIPDSVLSRLFGKDSARVKYISMGRFPPRKGVHYYLVKAVSGNKKAALIYAFENESFGAVVPFLVPDTDRTTSQVSVIDNSNGIVKNIYRRTPDNLTEEGKDVYEYYTDQKQFALILTIPLNRANSDVQNPIDTLPRKHKFAGDYIQNKRNYVSVRDGRYPNQLLVFIHFEKNEGSCVGELKGELLITSGTTAVYRQGGDPCVLSLKFTASSVELKEQEGCGSRRGLDCLFDGTYSRKKEPKSKTTSKKK